MSVPNREHKEHKDIRCNEVKTQPADMRDTSIKCLGQMCDHSGRHVLVTSLILVPTTYCVCNVIFLVVLYATNVKSDIFVNGHFYILDFMV